MTNKRVYVADFETTVRQDFACVWLYSIVNIDNLEEIYYGYSIKQFMDFIYQLSPDIIYFHNLKFDGMYIIDYLLRNGYTTTSNKALKEKEFSCLIGDLGQFYSIVIQGNNNRINIWDSLKIYNFSVKEIAENFHLDISKGEIDYEMPRPEGYVPTKEELDYVTRDVLIVAQALHIFRSKGYSKMTIASNALTAFRGTLEQGKFRDYFPELSNVQDNFCRRAYRGGFTYVNPKYQDKPIKEGSVYDINSMYPWALYNCPMPYGEPTYFCKEPPKNKLYIRHYYVEYFHIKDDHIPTIQLKNNWRFSETEYLTEAEEIDLYLTNVDFELFKEQYDYDGLVELEGFAFSSKIGMFKDYIDYYMQIKMESKGADRQIAKLFLNGLYGKFGTKPEKAKKYPIMFEGKVKMITGGIESSGTVYIPVACFVTAWARDNIIRNAQKVYDRFIYCDTDSLHLIGFELPDIPIDDKKLGYYKQESLFTNGKYLRPKTYIEEIDGELSVKCCGMNKDITKNVTQENFYKGAVFEGKLVPKIVPGGVVLQPTTFTIQN